MSILSTNRKLIKVGQEYSAGSGISIDDFVISVTGEFGKTYSAGDNISIYQQDDNYYISGKDWSFKYDTSSFDEWHSNQYTNDLSQLETNKLNTSSFSSVSGDFLVADDITGKQDTLTFHYLEI